MKRVLVIGDIIIDRYNYVTTSRKAPEAPIPVWDHCSTEYRAGGAANVAANIASIGGPDFHVSLAGIAHRGDIGRVFKDSVVNCFRCYNGSSMLKDRYVNAIDNKYLFRTDNMKHFSEADVGKFEHEFLLTSQFSISQYDAVVFSDYGKDTLSDAVIESAMKSADIRIVDSKRLDLRAFNGCDIVKLNEFEYSRQVSNAPYHFVEDIFKNVVITKGKNGAALSSVVAASSDQTGQVWAREKRTILTESFPVKKVEEVDVTGCGDTHVAAMTVSLLRDRDVRRAIKFANDAASKVVQSFGTSLA